MATPNTGNSASATATLPTHSAGQLLVVGLKSAGAAPLSDDGATWTRANTAKNDAKSIAFYTKTAASGSESAPVFTVTSGAWTTLSAAFDASGIRTSAVDQSGFSQTPAVTLSSLTIGDLLVVLTFAQNQSSYTATITNVTVQNTIQATDTTIWADGVADATSETCTVTWSGFTFDNALGLALIPAAPAAAGAYLSPMRGIV